MTVGDLLFLFILVATAFSLPFAAGLWFLGRRPAATRILRAWGLGMAAHMTGVLGVALTSPARVLAVGEDHCFDDWCIAVLAVHPVDVPSDPGYEVTFRLASRARRVSQRERGIAVWVRDTEGRRYDADDANPPFDVRLDPQEVVTTVRRFHVPSTAHAAELVIGRAGLPFPGCCIVGDENSVLHRKTVVRI